MSNVLQGACEGQRVIIGGFAPTLDLLPNEFYAAHKVIGLNQYPTTGRPCDYLLMLDSFLYPQWRDWLSKLDAEIVMRKPSDLELENYDIPVDAADHWVLPASQVQTEWNGSLEFGAFSFVAALNLAVILGASEVVLAGIDFCGDTYHDGSPIPEGFWASHLPTINETLFRYSEFFTIYKTNPDSPLEALLLPTVKDSLTVQDSNDADYMPAEIAGHLGKPAGKRAASTKKRTKL